jgi:hypothetical protein
MYGVPMFESSSSSSCHYPVVWGSYDLRSSVDVDVFFFKSEEGCHSTEFSSVCFYVSTGLEPFHAAIQFGGSAIYVCVILSPMKNLISDSSIGPNHQDIHHGLPIGVLMPGGCPADNSSHSIMLASSYVEA